MLSFLWVNILRGRGEKETLDRWYFFLLASVNANQTVSACVECGTLKELPTVLNNGNSTLPILSLFVLTAVELALPLF